MSWWYEMDGQQAGPVSEAELMELYDNNRIGDATLVWQSGMGEWVPFAKAWPAKSAARAQSPEQPRQIWTGIPEGAYLSLPLALVSAFDFMRTRDAILIAMNGLLIYIAFLVTAGLMPYYLGVILLQSATLGVWLTFILDLLRRESLGTVLKRFSSRQVLPLMFHSLAVSGVFILAAVAAGGITYLADEGSLNQGRIRDLSLGTWATDHPGAAAAILVPWAVMLWGWGMSLPLIMDRHLSFSAAIATAMQLAKRFYRPIGGLVILAAALVSGYWILSHALMAGLNETGEPSTPVFFLSLGLGLVFLYLSLWMIVAYLHLYLQLFPLPAPPPPRKPMLSDPFASPPSGQEKR